jgi:hypothetical protein
MSPLNKGLAFLSGCEKISGHILCFTVSPRTTMDLSNLPASTVTPVVTGTSMSSLSDLHFSLSSLLKTTQLRIALIQKNKRSLESVAPPIDEKASSVSESVTRESSVEIAAPIHSLNHIDYIESEPILDGDYSKVKVTTQVPLQQYMTYMEQYLRNINEEDLKFLKSTVNMSEQCSHWLGI